MITLEPKIYRIRNFFRDLAAVRTEAANQTFGIKSASYQGHESLAPISDQICKEVVDRINGFDLPHFGFFNFKKPRFRLALEGEKPAFSCPHSDGTVGIFYPMYSLILYLSDPAPGENLGFYTHDTLGKISFLGGYHVQPEMFGYEDPSRWRKYDEVAIEKNMGLLFPSLLFHNPTPQVGRGTCVEDGRLIIPIFMYVGFDSSQNKLPDQLALKDL
jgi:hypothetical protein